jgi:GxxExxY protein
MSLKYQSETYKIIGICMEVHKYLGSGFLEIVYKEALIHELKQNFNDFETEKQFKVNYKEIELNHHFYADLIVFGKIILEIKSIKSLQDVHSAQTLNYLKVSGLKVALLINFGDSSLTYKRIVL